MSLSITTSIQSTHANATALIDAACQYQKNDEPVLALQQFQEGISLLRSAVAPDAFELAESLLKFGVFLLSCPPISRVTENPTVEDLLHEAFAIADKNNQLNTHVGKEIIRALLQHHRNPAKCVEATDTDEELVLMILLASFLASEDSPIPALAHLQKCIGDSWMKQAAWRGLASGWYRKSADTWKRIVGGDQFLPSVLHTLRSVSTSGPGSEEYDSITEEMLLRSPLKPTDDGIVSAGLELRTTLAFNLHHRLKSSRTNGELVFDPHSLYLRTELGRLTGGIQHTAKTFEQHVCPALASWDGYRDFENPKLTLRLGEGKIPDPLLAALQVIGINALPSHNKLMFGPIIAELAITKNEAWITPCEGPDANRIIFLD